MKKVEMVKGTIGLMNSVGVASIMGSIVKATVPLANFNPVVKGCVYVSTVIVGSMIETVTTEYMEKEVDRISKTWSDIVVTAKK